MKMPVHGADDLSSAVDVDPVDLGIDRGDHAASASKWRRSARLLNSRQRALFVFSVTARIFVGFCDLALAASMYILFLLLQERTPQHALTWLPKSALYAALVTALVVIIRALADATLARFVFRQIQSIHNSLLLRLTRGYSQMRWSKFVERNRSELSHHAINTARDAADFYHRCIEMTAGVIVVAVLSAALVYQSPIAALAFVSAVATYFIVYRIFASRKIGKAAHRRELALRDLQRNVMGMLSAGKEIRTYGAYAHFGSEIEHQAERLAANNRQALFLPELMRIIADQGVVLLFIAAIVVAEIWHGDTHRLLSLLVFYFVLSRRLLPLVSQLSLIAGQMQSSYENVRIVAAELDECERHVMPSHTAQMPSAGYALELAHVNFAFDEKKPVLHDINLRLREGELAVLYGPSGIGKSSLLDLIAGVAQPVDGVIHVNRSSIAYVPQDIPLLDDSIRTNLLFGLPPKSGDELMHALKLARLNTFVNQLPKGLDSLIGDNGAQLSGGERQRLGLARAILRGGTLLLLDEATSALDEQNERAILENLRASGRTILLATHRTTSNVFAHRVLRVERGRLIEDAGMASETAVEKLTAGAF